jgi:tetraacyldisaccharide 4'-kinase
VDGLQRAGVICLTRADLLDLAGRAAVQRRAAELAPRAAWCEAAHAPCQLLNSLGEVRPPTTLAGRRVAAFCGIGNPAAFRRTLEKLGAKITFWKEFPDHHAYSAGDQADLNAAIAASAAELVVATHKDLVKLPVDELGGRPLWALEIEMHFLAGGVVLENALRSLLPRITS